MTPLISVTVRPIAIDVDSSYSDCSQWPHHLSNCRSYRFDISIVSIFGPSASSTAERVDSVRRVPAASFVVRRRHDDGNKDHDDEDDVPLRLVRERLVIRRPPPDRAKGLHRHLRDGDVIEELNGVEEPTFEMLYAKMVGRKVLHFKILRGSGADGKNGDGNESSMTIQSRPTSEVNETSSLTPATTSQEATSTTNTFQKTKSNSHGAINATTTTNKRRNPHQQQQQQQQQSQQKQQPQQQQQQQQQQRQKPTRKHPYPTISPNETLYPPAPAPSFPPGWTQRIISHNAQGKPKRRPTLLFYSPSLHIKFRSKKRALKFIELASGTHRGDDELRAWERLCRSGVDDCVDDEKKDEKWSERREESVGIASQSVHDVVAVDAPRSHQVIVLDDSASDCTSVVDSREGYVREEGAGAAEKAARPSRRGRKDDRCGDSNRDVAASRERECDACPVLFSLDNGDGTDRPTLLASESNVQFRCAASCPSPGNDACTVSSPSRAPSGDEQPVSLSSESNMQSRSVKSSFDRVNDDFPYFSSSHTRDRTELGLTSSTLAFNDFEMATREAAGSQTSVSHIQATKMGNNMAFENLPRVQTDSMSAVDRGRFDVNHSIDSVEMTRANVQVANDGGDNASFLTHLGSSIVKIEDEIQTRVNGVDENVSVSEQSFLDQQFVQDYPRSPSDVEFDCQYDGHEDDCSVDSSSSSCSTSSSSSSSLSSTSCSSSSSSSLSLSSSLSSSDMNEKSIKTQSTLTTQTTVPPRIKQTDETRKRPAPPTISSRSSNSTPTLTSSTPQTQPNNELQRLWPDPSDVIKALTRWMPPIAIKRAIPGKGVIQFTGAIRSHPLAAEGRRSGNSYVNPMLFPLECSTRDCSKAFKNADDMLEAFAYPLINEGLCSLNGDYHSDKLEDGRWDRQTYKLVVTNITEVSPIFRSKSYFTEPITMYEVQFSLKGPNKIPPNGLSELYAMHFPPWKTTKFGIVAHDFPTSISFGRSRRDATVTLKLWVCVVEEEEHAKNTGWITRKEFKMLLHPYRKKPLHVNDNVEMTLLSVGSTINIVRQFEALKSLPHLKPHLQKAIFTSHVTLKIPSQSSKNATRPTSVPLDIWRSLEKTNNPYQLKSISDLLSGSCLENLSLIQGPPGTGKSSTIVGLVSALLSGKAPLPGSRQSRCLIHPGKTMGATLPEVYARNRILICATTNQAVDSLAWKIKNQSLGTSGKVGDFKMARFGSLPWEGSRDKKGKRPEVLSEMERFLYDINVDVKAYNGYDDYDDGDSEEEWGESWTPPENKRKKKKRKRYRGAAQLRSEILSSCNVVLATLSGAGSKAFIEAVCRKDNKVNSEFRAVIVDEACQSSEPESLIPFKFNPTTVTLVGDPQQLPVLTLSGSSFKYNIFERSLFERLQNLNWPTILLREQYRMHESIAAFPSQEFYQGQLITSNNVKRRPVPAWASNPCFGTLAFWDSNSSTVTRKGHGLTNKDEAKFITRILLTTFARQYLVRSDECISVGIISFYKDQVKLLQDELVSIPVLRDNTRLNVKVATVDGFQGSECDIIILSCVRSHDEKGFTPNIPGGKSPSGVGFLKDCRRVNVALTRAKCSLWIIGNSEVLKTSPLWSRLIKQLEQRHVLGAMGNFCDALARYKASQE